MINKNSKELLKRYKLYSKQLLKETNKNKRYLLINYCAALRAMINYMRVIPVFESYGMIKYSKSFNNYASKLTYENLNDFIDKKDYHYNLLSQLLPKVEIELDDFDSEFETTYSSLDKKEFMEILKDFSKKYKINNELKDIIKNNRIYEVQTKKYMQFRAFTCFDPMTKKSDVMMDSFNYTINDQRVIFHELGHIIDFNSLDPRKVNEYIFMSSYIEVLSTTIERLFLRYLRNNNVLNEENRILYKNFLERNYSYVSQLLITTLFDTGFLRETTEKEMDLNSIMKELNYEDLYDKDVVEQFFLAIKDFDLRESLIYSYGDIISLSLADKIEKEGLNNEMYSDFNNIRLNLFDIDFMDKYKINDKSHVNRLKKEISLFK